MDKKVGEEVLGRAVGERDEFLQIFIKFSMNYLKTFLKKAIWNVVDECNNVCINVSYSILGSHR